MENIEKESTFFRKKVSTSLQNEEEQLIFILKSFYIAKTETFMPDFRVLFQLNQITQRPIQKDKSHFKFCFSLFPLCLLYS